VRTLRGDLCEKGIRSKLWTTQDGVQRGGTLFDRGALYHLLQNHLYTGHVPFKCKLFDGVQAKLADRRRRPLGPLRPAILTGILFDAAGRPMTSTYSVNAQGRRYRYYIGRTDGCQTPAFDPARVPAQLVERIVRDVLVRLEFPVNDPALPPALKRAKLGETSLALQIDFDLALQAIMSKQPLANPPLIWPAGRRRCGKTSNLPTRVGARSGSSPRWPARIAAAMPRSFRPAMMLPIPIPP
jgi:hypothetical protein